MIHSYMYICAYRQDPDVQRQGVGRQLAQALLTLVWEAGRGRLIVWVGRPAARIPTFSVGAGGPRSSFAQALRSSVGRPPVSGFESEEDPRSSPAGRTPPRASTRRRGPGRWRARSGGARTAGRAGWPATRGPPDGRAVRARPTPLRARQGGRLRSRGGASPAGEFDEPAVRCSSERFSRGFVVSRNLRNTVLPFHLEIVSLRRTSATTA